MIYAATPESIGMRPTQPCNNQILNVMTNEVQMQRSQRDRRQEDKKMAKSVRWARNMSDAETGRDNKI
jgi:hypothetical protein